MSTTQTYYTSQPRTYTYTQPRTYQQASQQPATRTYYSSPQVPRALAHSFETSRSGSQAYTLPLNTQTSYVTGERIYDRSFDRSTSLQALPASYSYVSTERSSAPQRLINFHTHAPAVTLATNRQQSHPFVGMGMRTNAKDTRTGLQCDVLWSDGPAQNAGIKLEDEIITIGNSGDRLTSLRQAQGILEREARVGSYIRVVGRHADTGYRYETHVRVMTRDAGTGRDYFDTSNRKQEALEKPLSAKNSLHNPSASRLSDCLVNSVVRENTSARASEAALGRSRSMQNLEW